MLNRMFFLTTALVAGCLSGVASAQTADVLHYWTSGGEAKALAVIAEEFKKRGGTWVDNAVTGFEQERSVALNRIAGGKPPTAMLSETGTEANNLEQQGILRNFNDSLKSGGWDKALPPAVVQRATSQGNFFAIPADLGGANWMWYSTRIFGELKLDPPKTWDDFFAMADKIKAAGYIPFAMGGQSWQEGLLFRSVLISSAGKADYRKIFEAHDKSAAGGQGVVKAFSVLRQLSTYADAGSNGRNWNDATNLVITNKAALQIMGDWAKGEFTAAGLVPGKDYGCDLAPGTADAYDMLVDVFIFPKSDNDKAAEAQQLLANVLMDPKVQVEFAKYKGSLPPRLDADVSGLDICAQKGQAVIKNPDNIVPSINEAFSADVGGQIEDLVTQFWSDPSMKAEDAAAHFAEIVGAAH